MMKDEAPLDQSFKIDESIEVMPANKKWWKRIGWRWIIIIIIVLLFLLYLLLAYILNTWNIFSKIIDFNEIYNNSFSNVNSVKVCTLHVTDDGSCDYNDVNNHEYIYIKDKKFYINKEGKREELIFKGINVVLKGDPWLPLPNSEIACENICKSSGKDCYTFGIKDIQELKSNRFNSIRLGISWQGAEKNKGSIDPEFITKLTYILDLCEENDIYVLLDNHGDQWAPQSCGFGLPTWLVDEATSKYGYTYTGKNLEMSDLSNYFKKFSEEINNLDSNIGTKLISSLEELGIILRRNPTDNSRPIEINLKDNDVDRGGDFYRNGSCKKDDNETLNGRSNNNSLGWTKISQMSLNYIFTTEKGQEYFIEYWKKILYIVKDYKCIIGCELMNEPPYINRRDYFKTVIKLDKEIKADNRIDRRILIGFSELYSGLMYDKNILKYINPLKDKLIDEYSYLEKYLSDDISDGVRLYMLKYTLIIINFFIGNTNLESVNDILSDSTNFDTIKTYIKSDDFKNIIKELFNLKVEKETTEHIKKSDNFFIAWHDYKSPPVRANIGNIINEYTDYFQCGNIMTESTHCDIIKSVKDTGNSTFKWKYKTYCSSSPVCIGSPGQVKDIGECDINDGDNHFDLFGACILGWGDSHGLLSCEDKCNDSQYYQPGRSQFSFFNF